MSIPTPARPAVRGAVAATCGPELISFEDTRADGSDQEVFHREVRVSRPLVAARFVRPHRR